MKIKIYIYKLNQNQNDGEIEHCEGEITEKESLGNLKAMLTEKLRELTVFRRNFIKFLDRPEETAFILLFI